MLQIEYAKMINVAARPGITMSMGLFRSSARTVTMNVTRWAGILPRTWALRHAHPTSQSHDQQWVGRMTGPAAEQKPFLALLSPMTIAIYVAVVAQDATNEVHTREHQQPQLPVEQRGVDIAPHHARKRVNRTHQKFQYKGNPHFWAPKCKPTTTQIPARRTGMCMRGA